MVVARLKEATQACHFRVEEAIGLNGPNLSLERYRRVLERFYGFWFPWEQRSYEAVSNFLPVELQGRHNKAELLEKDLIALGCMAPAQLPRCSNLPSLDSKPRLLGSMYVIEGSTLGGSVLARQLHSSLGLTATSGLAFFHAYGDQVGPMWASFKKLLEKYSTPDNDDQMVDSALQTFHSLENWFQGANA